MKKKILWLGLSFLLVVMLVLSSCVGAVGPKGAKGDPGDVGQIGPAGEKGDEGNAGEIGPAGEQGVAGRIGAKGATGSAGATGEQGEQGPAGIGYSGPAGVAGATGATGATGADGPQGPAGADGSDGAIGPAGAQGIQGIQGIQGVPGPRYFTVALSAKGGASANKIVGTTARLQTGTTTAGDEARIVITPTVPMTLGQLQSISWSANTANGYPPHIDITLDIDGDGIVDPEDVLTAEMAYNCVGAPWDIVPLCSQIVYNMWLQAFERTPGDGYASVTDSTMLWVTKMGAGDDDAPWGTLAQWKASVVGNDPQNELSTTIIDCNAPIVKIEIEIDNWVVQTDALVDCITINGTLIWVP